MRCLQKIFLTAMVLLLIVWGQTAKSAHGVSEPAPNRTVLIVAFGTSIESAKASYAAVERQVRESFPDRDIKWAWTAHSLLNPEDKQVLSPQEALAGLATRGVKEVDILSLHVIPGHEYNNLVKTARAFEGLPKGLDRVRVSPPLFWDAKGMREVAGLLLQNLPEKRKAEEGVIFVGHGTEHPSGVYYGAMQYYLNTLDSNAFVGTVEGDPDLDAVRAAVKAKGLKKVWLVPLMTVAGDHAANDLFGDDDASWRQRLSADGLRVETVRRGLGELPAFAARWVAGLGDGYGGQKPAK